MVSYICMYIYVECGFSKDCPGLLEKDFSNYPSEIDLTMNYSKLAYSLP